MKFISAFISVFIIQIFLLQALKTEMPATAPPNIDNIIVVGSLALTQAIGRLLDFLFIHFHLVHIL